MIKKLAWPLVGIAIGLVVGGTTAVTAAPQQPDQMDGVTVDCTGNGQGGYRRCDVHVDKPGPVRRMDYYVYVNREWVASMNVSGINPRKRGINMVPSPLRVEVGESR